MTSQGKGSGDGLPTSTAAHLSDSSAADRRETLPGQTALAADPFIGRVLSHYRLEEPLGAGGMGVLYRATAFVANVYRLSSTWRRIT